MPWNSFPTFLDQGKNEMDNGFRNFGATIERREQSRAGEVCLDYLQPGPKKEAERTNSDVRWLAACRTISDGRRRGGKTRVQKISSDMQIGSRISPIMEETLNQGSVLK